jgi:hypothetical protein
MGWGKRRGFGGMGREVVDMLREYFRMSRGCCGGMTGDEQGMLWDEQVML